MTKNKTKAERLYELKKKDPVLAVILSLLIIGAGSIYAGKTASGIIQLVLSIVLWMFFLGWIMWIISPFIAYSDAKKTNEELMLELDLI